jgi:diguanylate cyclase (GGDEF)-like protein/PAS domain S-box-containing protein
VTLRSAASSNSAAARLQEPTATTASEVLSLLDGVAGACVYEVACNGAETVMFVSSGIETLTGLAPEEFLSGQRTLLQLVHTQDAEELAVTIDKALVDRTPYNVTYRVHHVDGSTRTVHEQGHVLYDDAGKAATRGGLILDITDQAETQEQLRSQLTLLDVLMDTTTDNVYFKDEEGRFLKVSAAQARWLRLSSPDEAIGKSDFDFFAEEHASAALADEQGIMRTGQSIIDAEERDTWKDGRMAWVSTTKMPLHDGRGNVIGTFGISRDITKRKMAELAIQENQERMNAIINTQRDAAASSEGAEATLVLIAENASTITKADGAALLLLDDESGQLVVRTARGILESAQGTEIDPSTSVLQRWLSEGLPRRFGDAQSRAEVAAVVAGIAEARSLALAPVHADGKVVGFLEVVGREPAMFRPQDEEALELLSVVVTAALGQEELRLHAQQSEYQALHDALTGLPNRVLFHDRIQQALLTAERDGGRVAVMLLDLDRFKEINDTLGHASGDHVLREVSQRLNGCLRASDTVARLGGDEFGLLLPKQNESSDVVNLLDKLAAAIEEPIDLDGLPLGIEGSIGVAFYPDHGLTAEELMQRADVAMYTAKQDNRPHAFYEHAGDHHDPIRLSLVGDLRRAIDERQLVLYYQPKAALADGAVNSVEALLRWFHPERGMIPPDEFIPQAQETGLMKPLTLYVMDEALRQAKEWQEQGLDLAVSINVGTRNLIDVAFPDDVEAALAKWEVDPGRLEIEITESTMLDDPFRTKVVLDKLHSMGIRLSIDDFGTGYSSLAYLRQLPVSEIKIDRSFVLNMMASGDDAVIVRSTIDLGRNLGLQVVAEGVETEDGWQQLADLGCDVAQGYFLSRPVPAEELGDWLRERVATQVEAP